MDNQNIPVPPKMTQEDKSFVKYLIVSALLLLLWAVLQLVNVQVSDREKYMDETMAEVSKTWSGQQYVYGPCIRYDNDLYRDTTTVIHYGYGVIGINRNHYLLTYSGQCFIYRIVNYLVY